MDMWKPFRTVTNERAPQAAILFDKFHVLRHLGEALDQVRKSEYARLTGKERRYIKGQKYTLLSHRENLDLAWPPGPEGLAGREQTIEYRLPAQGVLRSTLELRARGMGTALLRELARQPQVATAGAV